VHIKSLHIIIIIIIHGNAPQYLSDRLSRVADIASRKRLRSSTFIQLTVRRTGPVTVGGRSFASADSQLRNGLPNDITSASSSTVFRRKLKTHLFQQSYRSLLCSLFAVVVAVVVLAVISHL